MQITMDDVVKYYQELDMKKKIYLLIDAILFVVLMNFIEAVLMPGYWIKSLIKFIYIVLSVVVYCGLFKKRFNEAVYFNKAKLPWVFYAGLVGVYILFIIGFLLIKDYLNINEIENSLLIKENITKQNCLYVFAYIIVINSLLEEIFFRGLIFHGFDNRLISYLVSGISFSLYHLSMIANWGNAFIFVLMLVLLFLASVVLQIFSLHFKSLKASYLVHAMSNLAINSLGFYIIYFM